MTFGGLPHRRFNPLRQEWVLVSPHRETRPWQGELDPPPPAPSVAYDPSCYLCPGNERAGGARNPSYSSTFAFDNDYPALLGDYPTHVEASPHTNLAEPEELLVARPERGICRVVCFSPRHDVTLGGLDAPAVRQVVDAWIAESCAIAAHQWIRYALIFENRGALMGASNPHPHCQIWATEQMPNEPAREQRSFNEYRARHKRCLLCDYAARESELGERLVCDNDRFLAVVPFWAVWPFETLLMSRRHVGALGQLDERERDALADILWRLTRRYDRLFNVPFPYSMGFHQQGLHSRGMDDWHLHAHYYPPLLRSAAIRKFMVGFELLGSPQRDLTPEQAAARLRQAAER
jgi:UDPglucose--hexose-1-phosphate uridylyltransferase